MPPPFIVTAGDHPITSAPDWSRETIDPYRECQVGKDGRSEVLLALSIGPFEVTRLRLAGDAASYDYGFSNLCGCRSEDLGGAWSRRRVVGSV
jgi:hypothetical protein